MKHFLFLALLLALFAAPTQAATPDKLTIADIVSGKYAAKGIHGLRPIAGTACYARISADGKRVEECDFATGKVVRTLFDRTHTAGLTLDDFEGYELSPDGHRMLIRTKTKYIYRRSFTAEYYLYNIDNRLLERLSDGGPQQIPTFSADGLQVAFVRDNNIFLVKLLYGNAESQVTTDGKQNAVRNGTPDWVYEEEFGYNKALAFNADGTMLCWVRWDERAVKTYDLQMFRGAKPQKKEYAAYPGLYSYKYPKAGEQNAEVSVWSYDIKAHRAQQLDVPLPREGYVPRLLATDDPARMIVFTLNRHQDQLCIYAANPRSRQAKLLIEEKTAKYVQEDAMASVAFGKQSIVLPSDRDGFMRLYIYSPTGMLQHTVSAGQADITAFYGYDEATGDVYYQAATPGPTERRVYVAHKNGKTQCLTPQPGWNDATFSGDYRHFVCTWSDLHTPPVYTLRATASGKTLSTMEDNAALKEQMPAMQKELFQFTTSEGVQLNGWMVRPAHFDAAKRYPVIMHQYSGPGSQQVKNAWASGSMGQGGIYDAYLAQQGFIVVCVDGRGTGARGAEFEKCTYMHLGELEARDQVETALWLGKQSYVDKDRIGIWGWSYGGFCTLMSMSEGRGVFRAGVAIAPPTDWRYYDTIYTERYMRTPGENKEGYDVNPCQRADKLHGALLICHGMADDNVHPQNTFEYAESLVQADKDFRELYYTNRNHGISGGNTRRHLLRQVAQWFAEQMK